uniref:Uncharacterized protein n=1 Tax=Triticum urartu TaxID=4572 RepID=A0A8R7QW20_TRIUA
MEAAMAGGPASASARGGRWCWPSSLAAGEMRWRQVVAMARGPLVVPFSDLKVPSSDFHGAPCWIWPVVVSGYRGCSCLVAGGGQGNRKNPRPAGPSTTAATSLDVVPFLLASSRLSLFPSSPPYSCTRRKPRSLPDRAAVVPLASSPSWGCRLW